MNSSIDIITRLFGGQGRTAILRTLSGCSTPLTGRQVAELTGLSPAGAARALDHLASLGVVSRRRVGRAVLHELRRDSYLVQEIVEPALRAEGAMVSDLIGRLRDALGALAVNVTLFGSVARGEAAEGSDIDVLAVAADSSAVDALNAVVDEVGAEFHRRYSIPLSVIVVELGHLNIETAGYLVSARDEGVLVSGTPLAELIRHDA